MGSEVNLIHDALDYIRSLVSSVNPLSAFPPGRFPSLVTIYSSLSTTFQVINPSPPFFPNLLSFQTYWDEAALTSASRRYLYAYHTLWNESVKRLPSLS